MTVNEDSLTHAEPRITELTFASILAEKHSPAMFSVRDIWPILLDFGVDPSFALAVFWTESLYGTAGWATQTGSWGNQLFVNTTIGESTLYKASNGYEYAKYANWVDAVRDYCGLLAQYEEWATEANFTSNIFYATAKWIGRPPGSADHIQYLHVVLWRMNQYDLRPPSKGDPMIQLEPGTITKKKFLLRHDTPLYDRAGDASYGRYAGPDTRVRWLGFINNTSWGAVILHTQHGSSVLGVAEDASITIANARESDLVAA